ncbi:MAG: GNAT family N-acetyltransferase [Actinomycetota bacterium]|nr:GNAT family N-acetyltransferase [Actinomycetota bacterium]
MHIEIPKRLEGEEILLRPLRVGDADAYAQAFVEDPELGRLIGFEEDPTADQIAQNVAGAADGAAAGKWVELAIGLPADESFRGSVVAHSFSEEHRRCEIGFWVVPSARRFGLATAALSRFLDWTFDELPIDRVEMSTTPDNRGTRGLAARLGVTEEGTFRKRNVERGKRIDLVTFGLLMRDWRARRSSGG